MADADKNDEAARDAQAQEDFDKFTRAFEAEPDPRKRRRLYEQEMARIGRERMAALVAVVENVRAKGGDEAAEATLKALRSFETKSKKKRKSRD